MNALEFLTGKDIQKSHERKTALLRQIRDSHTKEVSSLRAELSASQAREAELREALEWYAEKKNYYATGYGVPVLRDGGRRARSVYGGE